MLPQFPFAIPGFHSDNGSEFINRRKRQLVITASPTRSQGRGPSSDAHPCTAPCARRRRPTTQCDSRTGFNLPSVLHRLMHTVRQQPAHPQRQLATAVQPIAARTSTAACATVAQVCHTFSSPPASAAACIWCASLHSTVRTAVRVHRAAWISNGFQLAIRLAAVHAHGSAATRTLNDQPWPAGVHTIAAKSLHRNAPSGQQPVTHCASNQTTAVRTTRAPVGAPGCATLARAQSRNCRNIGPDQAHISDTNCIAVAAHRASRVSQPLRRFPRKTLPNRG